MSDNDITFEVNGIFAIITFNRPKQANSMNHFTYTLLGERIRQADAHPDTLVTIITGSGRFFSAGADVSSEFSSTTGARSERTAYLNRFASGSMDTARAMYTHSKILVAAVNGPCVGLSAGLIGWSDFIYCTEDAYVLTPFTSLGLIAEGGSSLNFVQRMGLAKAKETLILGERIPAKDLLACGFVNRVYPSGEAFLPTLLKDLDKTFSNLEPSAVKAMKAIIHRNSPLSSDPDGINLREINGALDRFATNIPQKKFANLAAANVARRKARVPSKL